MALSGSTARGEARDDSDLDVLVELDVTPTLDFRGTPVKVSKVSLERFR